MRGRPLNCHALAKPETWPVDADDRRYIAYCEEHGTEPEECRDCLALVDRVDDGGRCPDCALPRPVADLPVTVADFSNPVPIPDREDEELPF